jgi:prophage regulatory protein
MNAPARFTEVDRALDRIVRVGEVTHRTGLHRATIYRKIAAGEFPAGIALGVNSTGWYESEVNAWIANPTGWPRQRAS